MKNIDTLYIDALGVLEDLNIEVGTITSVTWNNRFKSAWGRCHYNRKTNTYRIELNSILGISEVSWEQAMNTMIHEVLHAHKDRFCHTGEWKRCAELVNREYPIYHICRCTSAEEKNVADKMTNSYNYIVKCTKCGGENKYKKAGKIVKLLERNPHSCRCSCGNDNLILIKC